MKHLFTAFVLTAILADCGGGREAQEGIYTILFEPTSTTISGGICSSHVKISGDMDENVTLIGSEVILTDKNDSNNRVTYEEDVGVIFGAVYLPEAGLLEGDLSIDGGSKGMSAGYDVVFLVLGSAMNGYPRNWLGYLECN